MSKVIGQEQNKTEDYQDNRQFQLGEYSIANVHGVFQTFSNKAPSASQAKLHFIRLGVAEDSAKSQRYLRIVCAKTTKNS
jgi:hypothetical protein